MHPVVLNYKIKNKLFILFILYFIVQHNGMHNFKIKNANR